MTSGKDLPKVIEKSQEEIEEIITLLQLSNLPEEIKSFVIGCIHLASWMPKALVEHKITVSNLKRLLFGKGNKTTQKQPPKTEISEVVSEAEKSENSNETLHEPTGTKGYGRLPHTAYANANEHNISIETLSLTWIQSCRLAESSGMLEPFTY